MTRLFASPMLARCESSFTDSMNFFPDSRPPFMPKPISPPKWVFRYFLASLWFGLSSSPG